MQVRGPVGGRLLARDVLGEDVAARDRRRPGVREPRERVADAVGVEDVDVRDEVRQRAAADAAAGVDLADGERRARRASRGRRPCRGRRAGSGCPRRTGGGAAGAAVPRLAGRHRRGARPPGGPSLQPVAPGSGSRSRPRSTASAAAAARLGWPSLPRMRSTWVDTVRRAASRRSAIASLPRPQATSVSTSSSRAVSAVRQRARQRAGRPTAPSAPCTAASSRVTAHQASRSLVAPPEAHERRGRAVELERVAAQLVRPLQHADRIAVHGLERPVGVDDGGRRERDRAGRGGVLSHAYCRTANSYGAVGRMTLWTPRRPVRDAAPQPCDRRRIGRERELGLAGRRAAAPSLHLRRRRRVRLPRRRRPSTRAA